MSGRKHHADIFVVKASLVKIAHDVGQWDILGVKSVCGWVCCHGECSTSAISRVLRSSAMRKKSDRNICTVHALPNHGTRVNPVDWKRILIRFSPQISQ